MDAHYRFYADIVEPGDIDTVPVFARSIEEARLLAQEIAADGMRGRLRRIDHVHDWDMARLSNGALLCREEALSTCPEQLVKLMKKRKDDAKAAIERLRNGGDGWSRLHLKSHRLAHSAMAGRLGELKQQGRA